MKKFFQNLAIRFLIRIHTMFLVISIALRNTEVELLKANPDNLDESSKKTTRKLHHNRLLEKFYAGQRDEKYMQDYYDLLKKVNKFIRETTPHKMAVAGDRHGMNYGLKDRYGRRYEHLGFFDGKHKHSGKTIGEVLVEEFEERRTKDDDYELLDIIDNKPIEVEFSKIFEVVEKTKRKKVDFDFEMVDRFSVSKKFKFPIKIVRENDIENDIENKIEQLTESLHVKKIGFEHRQLEFLIPIKFKTLDYNENSDIFKELITFNQVYVKNEYGDLIGYNIIKFTKRITHNDTHDVFKFHAIMMETVSGY